MKHRFRNTAFGFLFAAFGHALAQVPEMPIPESMGAYLDGTEIMGEMPTPPDLPPGAFFNPIRIIKKAASATTSAVYDAGSFVGSTLTDGGQYVLSTTNTAFSTVAGGVQWTSSALGDGVGYVVTQTGNVTVWTVNTGLEGVKMVVRQTGNAVTWSIEKAVPDRLAIGGVTYVRLDPVKNVVKVGIAYSVKVSATSLSAAQATNDFVIQTTAGLAVGAVDLASGSLNLSLDIATFAVSNTAAITSAIVDLDAEKLASRTWAALYAATTNILNWGDLGHCGSTVGYKNLFYTNVIVTDYWPPDEQVTNLLNVTTSQCRIFGLARLYKGCLIHDECYGVQGKTKAACDDEIKENWNSACRAAYGGGYCYKSCEAAVGFFQGMLAKADSKPFLEAQIETANNSVKASQKLAAYNDAKTRYNYVSTEYPIMNNPQPPSYTPRSFIELAPQVRSPIVQTAIVPLLL